MIDLVPHLLYDDGSWLAGLHHHHILLHQCRLLAFRDVFLLAIRHVGSKKDHDTSNPYFGLQLQQHRLLDRDHVLAVHELHAAAVQDKGKGLADCQHADHVGGE